MNESEIRKYAELMKELGLTGLEFTDDKKVVRLERAISAGTALNAVPVPDGCSRCFRDSGLYQREIADGRSVLFRSRRECRSLCFPWRSD